jgi:DNA-binding transcriptional ArsR family regulator
MSIRRSEAKLNAAAPLFAALGDQTRLRLVARLCAGGPASIAGLTAAVEVSRQAVTKHLHVLEGAGLVRGSRRGREQMWEIESAPLAEARSCLELISSQWDSAIERLRLAVEQE